MTTEHFKSVTNRRLDSLVEGLGNAELLAAQAIQLERIADALIKLNTTVAKLDETLNKAGFALERK